MEEICRFGLTQIHAKIITGKPNASSKQQTTRFLVAKMQGRLETPLQVSQRDAFRVYNDPAL